MAELTKERKQEILQHKIDTYSQKYTTYIQNGISSIKIDRMAILRDKFIAEKAELDAS